MADDAADEEEAGGDSAELQVSRTLSLKKTAVSSSYCPGLVSLARSADAPRARLRPAGMCVGTQGTNLCAPPAPCLALL